MCSAAVRLAQQLKPGVVNREGACDLIQSDPGRDKAAGAEIFANERKCRSLFGPNFSLSRPC